MIAYFSGSGVDSAISGNTPRIPSPGKGDPRPVGSWTERFRSIADGLRSLGHDTEGGVLSLGAALQALDAKAAEIAKTAGGVASAMSGEEIASSIGRLRELLDRMQGYLSRTDHETGLSEGKLRGIIHLLGGSIECMEGFRKIVKKLRILGISTRIESARLGKEGADFNTLAEDVERLSVLVECHLVEILSREQALDRLIRETLPRVLSIETDQRRRARRILDDVRAGLSTLGGIRDKYAVAAKIIADRYNRVSRNISEIIRSMQFHDIMRQQVEHVGEALEELAAGDATENGGDPEEEADGRNRRIIRRIADVCELQAAHAENARATFVDAVSTVIGNLREMAGNMARILEDARKTADDAGGSGETVLSEMERSLRSITSSLEESAGTLRKLAEATRSVAVGVEEMGTLVNDIEEIGSEVELIALNARVKAAHTGGDGAALGVLAESIQGLSKDTREQTAKVSDAFQAILSAAGELRGGIGPSGAGEQAESGVRGIIGDLETLLGELHGLGAGVESLLAQMEVPAHALSSDIGTLVAGIDVHHTVDRVLREAATRLKGIEREADALVPDHDGAGKAGNLGLHRARYTMQGERRVHEAILDTAAPAAPADHDGLGNNVELF
ncbi:MAG: hypothetical protein B7Z62_09275 [Deltaproteobacteria bacterium 37-65-8]|nr:MAG: hypothetical protein B7Z62_09275 [Deltaproteobacteria bacterium 37-65-8]